MTGTVYWLTGLSGAGKSTIGKALQTQLQNQGQTVVFLDGDEMREMLGVEGAFSYDSRKQLSFTYSRLCNLLAKQSLNVVCATISMFEDVRQWNRSNITKYKEVYIQCSEDTLFKRDTKGIYHRYKNEDMSEVAGFNLQVEVPKNPDLILQNDGAHSPGQLAKQIAELSEVYAE